MIEETKADQGAGQVQQPPEHVRPPLVAGAEAPKAEQPGEGPLDDPPVTPQPFAGLDAPPGDPGRNAASAKGTAEVRGVVGLVGVQPGRALPGTTGPSARPDDRGDGVDRIPSRLLAPLLARTLRLSTLARLQSVAA